MIFYKSLVIIGMPCLLCSASMVLSRMLVQLTYIKLVVCFCLIFFYSSDFTLFFRTGLYGNFTPILSRRALTRSASSVRPVPSIASCIHTATLVSSSPVFIGSAPLSHNHKTMGHAPAVASSVITVLKPKFNLLMSAPCFKRYSTFRLSSQKAASKIGKVARSSFTLAPYSMSSLTNLILYYLLHAVSRGKHFSPSAGVSSQILDKKLGSAPFSKRNSVIL